MEISKAVSTHLWNTPLNLDQRAISRDSFHSWRTGGLPRWVWCRGVLKQRLKITDGVFWGAISKASTTWIPSTNPPKPPFLQNDEGPADRNHYHQCGLSEFLCLCRTATIFDILFDSAGGGCNFQSIFF